MNARAEGIAAFDSPDGRLATERAAPSPGCEPSPPGSIALMPDDLILYETRGPSAWITLNRPDKLNAMTYALVDQLEAVGDGADRRDHVMADAAAQKCRKVKITEKNRIAHHTPVKPVEPVSL